MAKRRFIQTVTFYSYGDTPEEAFKSSQKIVDRINGEHDNDAEIEQMHENNHGKLVSQRIDLQQLKDKING